MKYPISLLVLTLFAVSNCGQMRGEKGDPGVDGLNGAPGIQGPTGATGSTGPTGDRGPAGVDATPVTMVKLCPGSPVYPTTFIEYAFCVNNKLYATYSANGGFTALLPPGAYTSNGINSRCDFNVSVNCQITN
jgi:hypothetical protein